MLNVQFSPVLITIGSKYVKVISELKDTSLSTRFVIQRCENVKRPRLKDTVPSGVSPADPAG